MIDELDPVEDVGEIELLQTELDGLVCLKEEAIGGLEGAGLDFGNDVTVDDLLDALVAFGRA